jgi:hypothetical protein
VSQHLPRSFHSLLYEVLVRGNAGGSLKSSGKVVDRYPRHSSQRCQTDFVAQVRVYMSSDPTHGPGESPPQVRRVPCSDHRCEGLTETVVNGEARLRDSERMGFSGTTGLHHQYFRA